MNLKDFFFFSYLKMTECGFLLELVCMHACITVAISSSFYCLIARPALYGIVSGPGRGSWNVIKVLIVYEYQVIQQHQKFLLTLQNHHTQLRVANHKPTEVHQHSQMRQTTIIINNNNNNNNKEAKSNTSTDTLGELGHMPHSHVCMHTCALKLIS